MTTARSTSLLPVDAVAKSTGDSTEERWRRITQVTAAAVALIIGARIPAVHLLTVGDLLAFALVPVWLGGVLRSRQAVLVLGVGALCLPSGLLLTVRATSDHATSLGLFLGAAAWMLGLIASVGTLLWACREIGTPGVAIAFSVGMLLFVDHGTNLFSSNPWKFGYSVPLTLLALSLAFATARRGLDLVVLLVLASVCLLTDTRSALGILLLAIALMTWQLLRTRHRPGTALGVLIGSLVATVAVYFIGQTLILSGAFGEETQRRSVEQVERAGSLIVGGRPEILASIRLIGSDVLGPGAGSLPNYTEVALAKQAMSRIDYDPNNGYVEQFMFGGGYSLHSVIGDLWAQWGLIGIAFVAVVLVVVVRHVTKGVASAQIRGLTLFLSCALLWNVFFAPWYSSIRLLELLLAVVLGSHLSSGATTHELPSGDVAT